MKKLDDPRQRYLEMCQELNEHANLARNYAMDPGSTWLAKAELVKLSGLISELESLLETIRQTDRSD